MCGGPRFWPEAHLGPTFLKDWSFGDVSLNECRNPVEVRKGLRLFELLSKTVEDVFATQFFHDRPFADVETDFLDRIHSSLENELFERRRQEEDFSALQGPIEDFGKALKQSNPNAEVTDLHPGEIGDDKGLPYRVRAFASRLTNKN